MNPATDISARVLHELVTPEGVPLEVPLAPRATRATAFILDFLILTVAVIVVSVCAILAGGGQLAGGYFGAFAVLSGFFIRNFYFVFFELRWQGRTPGKRLLGLRVIDRGGGPLTAQAVFARNLVRDVELFLPLMVIFAQADIWPGAPAWARILCALWALILLCMPLLNRDRMRVGDLVAGTVVIAVPAVGLALDVAERPTPSWSRAVVSAIAFTDQQLAAYGIYELQILEEVLRGGDRLDGRPAMEQVATRIQRKIGWTGGWIDPEAFLAAYYAQLRGRLEKDMLFGKRREDKYAPR
ncbi:MAG TPA: RDD family protein [Kofleriaceae bacterium]|nr:RDD family protein [Kofleriaceae bacterium]